MRPLGRRYDLPGSARGDRRLRAASVALAVAAAAVLGVAYAVLATLARFLSAMLVVAQ